jgi:hypothetical protein
MDNNKKLIELSDEIEQLQNWVVDHPAADHYAKMEVVAQWIEKSNERQRIITDQLRITTTN